MVKGGSPKKGRDGASSLNPRGKKFQKSSDESVEEGRREKLLVEAAVAAAQVVLTPQKDLEVEKVREAQSLIDKAKSLCRDDVIVEWPRECDEAVKRIKKEPRQNWDASSSSGLCLQGPPTNPDPGVMIPNPELDRDSNDE
eukprot:644154-Karenia_brevis.AAC.1